MAAPPPRRRFTIQPFKHKMEVGTAYADQTWSKLEAAIKEIMNHKTSGLSFEELYRSAYHMVLHKFGDRLYNGLRESLTAHLHTVAREISETSSEFFLRSVERRWRDYTKSVQAIRDILMYMDRTYVQQQNKTSVNDLALNLWRDVVIRHDVNLQRLQGKILDNIHRERMGEMVDRALLRNITRMFVDLGSTVYEKDFEIVFLQSTASFYREESVRFLATSDCPEYLKKAERRLQEEVSRCAAYLDPSSEAKITAVVDREMIREHMMTLVGMDSGFVSMMRDDVKYDDLARMYNLFKRGSEGISYLKQIMGKYIGDCGRALVTEQEKILIGSGTAAAGDASTSGSVGGSSSANTNTENSKGMGQHQGASPVDFVQRLLDLKDKFDSIIVRCFGNDRRFINAQNQAFEVFVNLNPRSSEYLSLYVDDKLRKGLKGVAEEDIDAVLDKIMTLFRFLQEKDVFEKYYKQHLAKRLLSGNSVSDDAERGLIVKLKTECGFQFTSKLESMFTDIRTSADTMANFKAQVALNEVNLPVDINVQVLTTGSWPTQTGAERCILPKEVESCCERFKQFYLSTHTGRRLTWQLNMGSALLKARFPGSEDKQLSVSTYQMCILVLFNEADSLSYREILGATDMAPVDLKRNLQSLACVKGKNVLRKEPLGRDIGEDDIFHFNDRFSSKFTRVKIGTVAAQKEPENRQETREKVEADRKPQIEAAIVRIMKSRRVLDHNNLITEVTKQLSHRFLPNPSVIKKRLESLIEREFLERDQANRKLYRYLA